MLINKAIEEIRKTRHEISAKHHHNTKELLDHYKSLEEQYSGRMYDKTIPEKLTQTTQKSTAVN